MRPGLPDIQPVSSQSKGGGNPSQEGGLGGWISRDILEQERNRLSPGVVMASQSSLGQIASASGACTGDVGSRLYAWTHCRSSQSKDGFDPSQEAGPGRRVRRLD